MTVKVQPIDASAGSPQYAGVDSRCAWSAFHGIAPSGRPLGAISGVRAGTPTNTVTATSSTWSCAAHSGVLDVESPAGAGPYDYYADGSDTGSMTAADPSNPRIDIVYVRMYDDSQDGTGQRKGEIDYLAGTAASSPVPPSTPTRSMVLAQISVPQSGHGSPSVTWVAPTFGAAPYGKITKTNAQNVANTSDVTVTFQTNDSETAAAWSGMADEANNRLTCLVAGVYDIHATIPWDGSSGGGRELKLNINGAQFDMTKKAATGTSWTGGGGDPQQIRSMQRLNVGDHVTMVATQNSGGTVQIDASGSVIGYMAMVWLGP